ncbi:MAG: PAS domain-containing protein, partial [Rhodospirillales bacterium]|nr:PAS domain-containing protein [Rhodospirillales bacterium]
ELANKEAQLRLAMDNMPGGMVLIDSEQNFLLFNQQYSELFDFPDDLIAEDRPILDMVSFPYSYPNLHCKSL